MAKKNTKKSNAQVINEIQEIQTPVLEDQSIESNENQINESINENEVKDSESINEVTKENESESKEDKKSESKNAIRFLTKDILAISIVDKKEVRLFEKMRVELIADDGELCTVKSNGKYYRVPRAILF